MMNQTQEEYLKELEHYCNYDTLTELRNNYAYCKACADFISEEKEDYIGIVFADLNGLKIVNDTRGHEKGNEYICDFANKLKNHFVEYPCYRVSGDEFLVIAIGAEKDKFLEYANAFRQMINEAEIPVASVGFCHEITEDIHSLIKKAEEEMYEQKHSFYEAHPEYQRSAIELNFKNQMDTLIQMFTNSYEILMVIDLETDSFEVLKKSDTYEMKQEREDGMYSMRNRTYCENYVSKDYKNDRLRFGSLEYIKSQLVTEQHIAFEYRLADGTWRIANFWRMESKHGLPAKVIYYSENLDHSMVQRLSHRSEIEKKFDILSGIRESYSAILELDMDDGRLHIHENHTLPDDICEFIDGKYCDDISRELASKYIEFSKQEDFITQTSIPYISKKLKEQKVFNLYFCIKASFHQKMRPSYAKFSFCLAADGRNSIILATKDITDMVDWYEHRY